MEIFFLLLISFSLPRTFGRMVGSNRQGYAILVAMAVSVTLAVGVERIAYRRLRDAPTLVPLIRACGASRCRR